MSMVPGTPYIARVILLLFGAIRDILEPKRKDVLSFAGQILGFPVICACHH